MQLYYARPSPFVRKVMVLLEVAGETGNIELIDGFGSPVAPNTTLLAANPIGKIPCLIPDNGPAIYDSRVITRYLDSHFGTGLYPQGAAIWPTLTLEAHADGILDAAVLSVYEVRCREEALRSADWVNGQHGKIIRGLDALEAHWLDHLVGPMDMAQISVGCVLGYLDFRREMGGWPDWREKHARLAEWGDSFLESTVMKASVPE